MAHFNSPLGSWRVVNALQTTLALGICCCAYSAHADNAPTVSAVALPQAGRAEVVPSATSWTRDDAAHLLRRAGFGGTPEQVDRLLAMGRAGAVDYLIDGKVPAGAKAVFEPVALTAFTFDPETQIPAGVKERVLAKVRNAAVEKGQAAKGGAAAPTIKEKVALKRAESRVELQLVREWWIDRMLRTDRPLEEKMTLFWHGLLTSGVMEVKNGSFLARQNELYHREALGNYQTLVHDVVHDCAMLKYLNNDENIKGKPNENLARELMELFTMGEGHGYTEHDIQQVARALTGLAPSPAGAFLRPRLHDDGVKDIFGKSGNFGPDDVVKLIFARPEPARYLALKLWTFYAYPEPSEADLAPVVAALKASHYEIKPALRAIFTSPAFYGDKAKFALIKSPAEMAVETWRSLGLETGEHSARAITKALKDMDQELFQPPNVKGWPGGEHWITAATLFTRYNVATAMVEGTLRGGGLANFVKKPKADGAGAAEAPSANGPAKAADVAKFFVDMKGDPTPTELVDAAVARFLQRPLAAEKRDALVQSLGGEAIHLGQADSDKRVRQMVGLLMSTPEYQVH